eukprot:scaffold2054_cov85-Isochrysis_galbana.AAC.3
MKSSDTATKSPFARSSLPANTILPEPLALISGESGKRQPQWPSGPASRKTDGNRFPFDRYFLVRRKYFWPRAPHQKDGSRAISGGGDGKVPALFLVAVMGRFPRYFWWR